MFIYQAGHEYAEGNISQFSLCPLMSMTISDQVSDVQSKLVARSWPAHEPHHTSHVLTSPRGLTNAQWETESSQPDIRFSS